MACVPAHYNLSTRVRGDTWPGVIFTVEVNEAAADFSGATFSMGFRKRGTRGNLALLLTSEDNDITVEENVVTVEPRVLELYPGDYDYDLQVTYSSGKIQTLVGGSITIKSDVTP